MSGRWSRACDEESWGDAHRTPARSAQLALTYITAALIAIEEGDNPAREIARAGAYVRAWRKSLPEQGRREAVASAVAIDRLLFWAGRNTLAALSGSGLDHTYLRAVERDLRAAWKQATR